MAPEKLVRYRSHRMLLVCIVITVAFTGVFIAALRPDEFMVFMVVFGPWLYIPTLFFAAYAVDLRPDDTIEVRYLLRRRREPVDGVRAIISSNGFTSHRITIKFQRGRVQLRESDEALALALALVQRNGN